MASDHSGEIGDTVLYVCDARHNAPSATCEEGDVHPGVCAEVLTRDSDGKPAQILLALLMPRLPSVQWVTALHGERTPGEGARVNRVHRGAPPREVASMPGESFEYRLDFPLNRWFGRDE